MEPKIGIDLVYIPKFTKSIKNGGEIFLKKIFLESELSGGTDSTHLAGIFAGKEAVIKALSLDIGSWLNIRIYEQISGKPKVQFLDGKFKNNKYNISISHDNEYAVAIFSILL